MWKARVPAAADSPAHPICAPTCENLFSSSFSPLPLYTFILPDISSPRPLLFPLSLQFSAPFVVFLPGWLDWYRLLVVSCFHTALLLPLQIAYRGRSTKLFQISLGFIFSSNSLLSITCTSNAEKNSALQSCFQHLAVVGSQVAIALLSASRGRKALSSAPPAFSITLSTLSNFTQALHCMKAIYTGEVNASKVNF